MPSAAIASNADVISVQTVDSDAMARSLALHARAFLPEQQDIVLPVAEIQIGTGPLGRKQHQPETHLVTPLLEFLP